MRKILFVVDERKMGGVSIVLEQIINSISSNEFKCDILVLHNNGDRLENLKNCNLIFGTKFFDVVDIPFMDLVKNFKLIKLLKKIYLIFLMKSGLIKYKVMKERKKIIKDNYDIEICFKDGFGTYFVAHGNTPMKIKWLHADYSKHNPGSRYKKSYTNAVDKYDKIVAISESVANNFNEIYHKDNITTIINNLVDIPKLKKIKKHPKEKYNLEIVTVGRLHKVKGYDRLLEVIYKLKQDGLFNNCVLKIVGDGEEADNLKKYVNDNNLNKEVIFYGQKNDPWYYLQNGDLFVISSYNEAFALTVVESLTMGIPILSTNYSSATELMTNDYNALIVENSTEGLYNGLKKIIENKKYLEKLKRNAKKYFYDNEKILKLIENLLRSDNT
ncbi:MAG: glycosyltransferase [Bacilli bacterium]